VKLSPKTVEQGTSLHFVGFKDNIEGPMYTLTGVTDVCNLQLAANCKRPKIRAINSETLKVDMRLPDRWGSGILINDDGIVQALWLTCFDFDDDGDVYLYYGHATPTILPIFSMVRKGEVPKLRIISVEFETITMSQARDMKVSGEWINRVGVANPFCH
jgi:pro-apoptotic serine protease NMA111